MITQSKHISRWIIPAFCSAILVILLVACGSGSSGSTPTPTPTPKPTPTAAPFSIYMGTGYTISYPRGWIVTNSSGNTVSFEDSANTYNLTIVASPDPNGVVGSGILVDAGIKAARTGLKNSQTETVSPTTTVGGETWSQKSVSGTATKSGQSIVAQIVVMADIHPANSPTSRSFVIVYGASKPLFEQASAAYFQPMLQSFKFV